MPLLKECAKHGLYDGPTCPMCDALQAENARAAFERAERERRAAERRARKEKGK